LDWRKTMDYNCDRPRVFFGLHACDINALNKLANLDRSDDGVLSGARRSKKTLSSALSKTLKSMGESLVRPDHVTQIARTHHHYNTENKMPRQTTACQDEFDRHWQRLFFNDEGRRKDAKRANF